MRTTKIIFSLLNVVALAKSHLRPKMFMEIERCVIATLEDLEEVLRIAYDLNGMPTYKLKFLREIFIPLYNLKSKSDQKDGGEIEKTIGVTTKELCDNFRAKYRKSITTDSLKKTYLNELLNNGFIDSEQSVLDKRRAYLLSNNRTSISGR